MRGRTTSVSRSAERTGAGLRIYGDCLLTACCCHEEAYQVFAERQLYPASGNRIGCTIFSLHANIQTPSNPLCSCTRRAAVWPNPPALRLMKEKPGCEISEHVSTPIARHARWAFASQVFPFQAQRRAGLGQLRLGRVQRQSGLEGGLDVRHVKLKIVRANAIAVLRV